MDTLLLCILRTTKTITFIPEIGCIGWIFLIKHAETGME